MQVTRRELYQLGEPFGESCTQARPGGRGRVYGGGGGSSSSSTTSQTFNTDKRLITGEGSLGVSADESVVVVDYTTNNTMSDLGAIAEAFGFGERSLETVELNNTILGDGYNKLLDATESLFQRGETLIGQTGDRIADAYQTANVEAKGSIDNRTITIIAIAGAVALVALNARK